MSPQSKPSIVFAHGLWADGSCYSKVIPTLQAEGHEVVVCQNSLDSARGRRRRRQARARAGQQPGRPRRPLQGGTVITAAGTDDRVAGARLHLRARAGRRRDGHEPAGQVPRPPTCSNTSRSRTGASGCSRTASSCFAGDLSEEEKQLVWATQGVPAADLFNEKVPGAAWKSKPSCYIVAATTTTPSTPSWSASLPSAWVPPRIAVDSSHVPMLSHPDVVLDAIRAAASAAQASMSSDAVNA